MHKQTIFRFLMVQNKHKNQQKENFNVQNRSNNDMLFEDTRKQCNIL